MVCTSCPWYVRVVRDPHGIFAAGGAYVPTQEKKKKHGMYELSHEFPNDLGFWILENKEISGKSQNLMEL